MEKYSFIFRRLLLFHLLPICGASLSFFQFSFFVSGALLRKKMELHGWDNGRFLIDGFPRNADNLEGWSKAMTVCVLDNNSLINCLCS